MYFIKRLIWHFKNEENLLRWVLSRFLFFTGMGRLLTINCGLYKIRFFPSSISLQKWLDPSYGNHDERLLRRILKPNDTVIDVGANIGTISLAAAALVGEKGRVLAFEPNPRIFKYLRKNIQVNNFKNIAAINCAVGDRPSEVHFSDQRDDDQNKIVSQGGKKLLMTTLDEQISAIQGRINLLKIDVEGYEKYVLLGASETLSRTDYIYFEVCETHFIPLGYKTSDFLEMLKERGFCSYRLDEQGKEIAVDDNFIPENYMNLLARRIVI